MHKVLIVDDRPEIRRLLGKSLGQICEVLEAVDGESGLRMAREHLPTLMLLDVMMPGDLDGLQVLDAVKADPLARHILVAMLTARGQVADREDALARGADGYFIKPFSPAEVLCWVRDRLVKAAKPVDSTPR